MGCGSSSPEYEAPPRSMEAAQQKPTGDDPAEMATSAAIERNLNKGKQQEQLKVKLLLLGAGESGKSTIFKQMRILYGAPRSDDDLRMYGVVVRSNIITAVRKLCQLLHTLELEDKLAQEPPSDGGAMTPKQAYDELRSHLVDGTAAPLEGVPIESAEDWVGHSQRAGLGPNSDSKQFLHLWRQIKAFWECETMKEVWQKRAAVNIIDGHSEFLSDAARIASPSYHPTQQDILLARVKTTQVIMERYRIDDIDFELYDVGGQRSERRKWIDCFDNVDAVIFVAALSEYDQTLAEARRTNRMTEALELFRSVCNNRAFAKTSIMLFLNKKDIFAEKIQYSDIQAQQQFEDYSGPPQDFNSGVLYFIQKFKDCLINEDFNDAFIHVTCATDTNNMEFVLDATRTIIMRDNLLRSGFLGTG